MSRKKDPRSQENSDPDAPDEAGYYQAYADFAKSLRAWFIAYGIGAPALVLSNKDIWTAVKSSGHFGSIGIFFLAGVTLQVLEAFLYKSAMWHLYVGELSPAHQRSRWYRIADKLSESFRFELFMDIGALLCFAAATVFLFRALS